MLVFVFDKDGNLHSFTSAAYARRYMKAGKAIGKFKNGIFAIYLTRDLINIKTVLLNHRRFASSSWHVNVDPGVKHTGLSLSVVFDNMNFSLININLHHRGDIARRLEKRKHARNQRRRRKHRRYHKECGLDLSRHHHRLRVPRKPDTYNPENMGPWPYTTYLDKGPQEKPEGWLPPSVVARIESILRWIRLLSRYAPRRVHVNIEDLYFTPELSREIEISLAEFGLHKDKHRGIAGTKSAKRAYIHWLYNYTCQYCGHNFIKSGWSRNSEIDHIYPRSLGGEDHLDNLTLSCHSCNQDKDNKTLEEWLPVAGKRRQPYIKKILKRGRAKTRRYGTLATVTRHYFPLFLEEMLYTTDEIDYYKWLRSRNPNKQRCSSNVTVIPGYLTSQKRQQNNLPKDHYVDAACLAAINSGARATSIINPVLQVTRKSRGNRQFQKMNASGFPRIKRVNGKIEVYKPRKRHIRDNLYHIAPWDMVSYRHPKYGDSIAYVTSVKQDGRVVLDTSIETTMSSFEDFKIVRKNDGYIISQECH